jgi:sodium/potassium-transporting ATPase subunit beta
MPLLLFLIVYKNPGIIPGDGKITEYCDFENYPGDKVCYVDPKEWSYCSSEKHYSYHKSAPCIFLKLNKVSQKSGLKKLVTKPI